jgi:hypothetical protein
LAEEMKYKRTIIWTSILAAGCTAVFLPKSEHCRKSSPNGSQVAIAYSRAIWSILPLFPGGGSDQPGWIRIETLEGVKIAEYSVEMLSHIQDLRWDGETARLPRNESE